MPSVILKILRIVHLARHYIGRTSSRWALFLAILRRKSSEWWHRRCQWPGKPGASKPAEPCISHGAGLCSSELGGPAVLRRYGVAASNVPESVSQGSLRIHVGAEGQPATAPPSPIPATLSVESSYSPNPGASFLDAADFASRSSSNVSIASTQSRASERRSRTTASRKALHTPVGQPVELPRSPHHQFGHGPDPSRSGGRLSRRPSPTHSLNTTQQPRLDVIQTVLPTHPHADGGISTIDGPQSPADMPSSPCNTREPQYTPLARQKQKATSLDVNVQSLSLESLPVHNHSQPLTEGPMAMSPTQPPVASSIVDDYEAASQCPSLVASEYYLPEGCRLQLINSEQIPRYSKNITMQVDHATVLPLFSLYIC
jgi:hypothetical protein